MKSGAMGLKRQQGAISILAALSIGVVIIVAALALDLGRVYWVKRDLQKAADLASMSAVSALNNPDMDMYAIAQRVVTENYQDATVDSVIVGVYDWPNYVYAPGGAVDAQNAVQVNVSKQVKYYFQPGSLLVTASATSAQDAIAGFSMGSFVARLNTADSALLNAVVGGLLGGSINLDLVSYQGLAAANITLAGIQAALNLGTVDEVLNADLLGASIAALQRNGDPTSLSAANTLLTLQAAMATDRLVTVGNVVKPDPDMPSSALNVDLNVLQLLQMGAMVANGGHFIDIPNLGVSLGGLGGVGLKLSVIQPPSIAIGPARKGSDGKWVTRAHAAQIRLKLNLDLNLLAINVHLPIYLEAGAADAALTRIQCRLPKDDSAVTISVNPQLLSVYLGEVDDTVMQNTTDPVTVTEATLVNVLGLIWIKGYAYAPIGGGTSRDLVFNGPFDQYNNQSTASLGIGSQLAAKASQPGSLKIHLILFTFDAGPLIDAILNVLNSLLDALLDPLLSLLGVSLGGADVTAFYLDCGVPQLVL